MKVTAEDFAIMQARIEPLDLEEYRIRYRNGDIARFDSVQNIDMRYRWDLYWFAARTHGGMPDSQNGYSTAHIDTALRKIVPPLTEKGK